MLEGRHTCSEWELVPPFVLVIAYDRTRWRRESCYKDSMRKLLLACVLVLGCGDASKKVEELADRACACKDKACAEKVIDDLATFAKENKNARGDEKKAAEAAERLATCAIKAGADPSSMVEKLRAVQ